MSSSLTYQRKQAFIIGINDYVSSPLACCINDAEILKNTLESIEFTVKMQINPNLKVFHQTFKEFVAGIQPTDLILFYFTGHSKPYERENYLLMSGHVYDTNKPESSNMMDNTISIGHIMKVLVNKNPSATIYIFDCGRTCTNHKEFNAQPSLLSMKAPAKTLVAYSNCIRPGACSETGNGEHGYLMENLLKYIKNPNIDIEEMLRKVGRNIHTQTSGSKVLYQNSSLNQKIFLGSTDVQDTNGNTVDESSSSHKSIGLNRSTRNLTKEQFQTQSEDIVRAASTDAVETKSSVQPSMCSQQKLTTASSLDDRTSASRAGKHTSKPVNRADEVIKLAGKLHNVASELQRAPLRPPEIALHLSDTYHLPIKEPIVKPYPSEIFVGPTSIPFDLQTLLEHLMHGLSPMNKEGPMSGKCIHETDQMKDFLTRNFGFHNIVGKCIVQGVQSFNLEALPSTMDPNTIIYFPCEGSSAFTMTVSEIQRWQNSFTVYADRDIPGMKKSFLQRALEGKSMNGREAFRMKFVVRISDCPVMMKFDAKILPRSLNDDWPNFIKLISMTGVDFAGRVHDVDDILAYITNWRNVFELDQVTGKIAVFDGRNFHPVKNHPPVLLNENLLLDHLKRMTRLRLRVCDREKVQIVVETGIGLGIFSGKHIKIDSQVRRLTAHALRCVITEEGATYTHIRAIVFALPIFSKTIGDIQIPDVYHDFVNEFHKSKYCGRIPVLIVDHDMHELAVAIACRGFRVSELNPADSHGVFGEYWQNYGPAVEEKLALTTLGLLVQHHLINRSVLDDSRYHII
ncbi:unnamed protein product [Rotaria magnacalcarata]|uniref:Peptidase C14 caspase domain-containing protein n=4 Tax=Rotaria magnacalcarata TaxID=392030 RepID=A0A819D7M2_9BILA|nr:unnamed protein product [Rotaria magnacalcarata]CAF3823832.1 unnamed protein product [Rotaria magnacalcarata]